MSKDLLTTYTITGRRTGQIVFKYDLNGDLRYFEFKGEPLSEQQRKWLYARIFVHESGIKHWHGIKEFTITKGEPEITFENFWKTYDLKQKKVRSQALWDKLSEDEKFNAIAYIRRFNNWLRLNGTAKPLPDTYLSQKRWLDQE